MKMSRLIGGALVGTVLCVATMQASDPTAVYTRIDRVVLEPNADAPQAIQIWGVFAMAKPDDRNDYLPPQRGYLYFTFNGPSPAVRAEWSDLKQVAGTGQIVSFGSRHQLKARLRPADERAANPDLYVLNFGVQKNRRTDYEPIKALLDFKK
jgi:hypothetical protein